VHAFAALALLHLGIPIGPISVMFGTIQLLHHFIQMAFGDSEISFMGTATQTPLQGVGQGNGAGPQIWAAVSSPIFDMVHNSGNGSTLQSLITQDTVQFVGFGFVDDVDLITTDNTTHRTASSILCRLQHTLDLWEMGLRISGGALLAKKADGPFLISIGKTVNGHINQNKISLEPF